MRREEVDISIKQHAPSGHPQSRKVASATLACGYALSPDSHVTRGRRRSRRRRSDYKPVLLQCGIISQDEFDGLMGMELLKCGDTRRKASKGRERNAGIEISVLLRGIVETVSGGGDQPSSVLDTSDLAGQLGVSPQRLGTIFTVLELLQVVDKGLERGTYRWRGVEHFRGSSEHFGSHGVGESIFRDTGLSLGSNGLEHSNTAAESSLRNLTKLFLSCLWSQQATSVADAVEHICNLPGNGHVIDHKNIEPQLADIAEILVELGLVRRLGSNTRAHPVYKWVGVGKPRRIHVAASRRNGARDGDNLPLGSTHKLFRRRDSLGPQERTTLMDSVHPSTSDYPKQAEVRFGHPPVDPPSSKSGPFQSHSAVTPAQSFNHYPLPVNMLSGTAVVQLNPPSSIPMVHQPEAAVRPLNSPYPDQFFGIMPLPANRLDGSLGGIGRIDPSLPLRGQMNFGHSSGRPAESVFTPVMAYAFGNGPQVLGNAGKPTALPQGKGSNSHVSLAGHTISELDVSRCEFGPLVNPQRHVNGLMASAEAPREGPTGNHQQLWVQDPRRDIGFFQPSLPAGSKIVMDNRDGVVRPQQDIFPGCPLEHWPIENGRSKSIQKDFSSLMNLFARGGVTQEGYMGHQSIRPGALPNPAGNIRQLQ